MSRQDEISERERCIATLKGYVNDDSKIYTLTTYGKGETDYVRVFVSTPDQSIIDITYYAARAAGHTGRLTSKGSPFGGGQYSKGLEAFDWVCRQAGVVSDQIKWREL